MAIPTKLGQNLTLEGKKLHISGDIPFYLVEKMKNGVRQELKRLEPDKIPQLSKESLTISGVSNTVRCFLDEVRTFFDENPEN